MVIKDGTPDKDTSKGGGRLLVTDKFQTRHKLAMQLLNLTDGEERMVGSFRMNIFGAVNRAAVKKGICVLKWSERGAWIFVHTLDERIGNEVEPKRAEKTGFILFKDKTFMELCTNDIADTPRRDVEGIYDYSLKHVPGFAPLKRWFDTESMNRTTEQHLK